GFDPRIENRIGGAAELGAERAIAAAPRIGAIFPVLGTFEVGKNLGIRPAGGAGPGPAVVIAGRAARIRHDVDGGAAAQDLAAHRLDAPVVEAGAGLRLVAPVVH